MELPPPTLETYVYWPKIINKSIPSIAINKIEFQSPNSGDGSYNYAFDTSNGISQQESGLGGQSAQGSFNYVSPEGQPIQISYVADQFGYRAAGSAIPVAPEIPPAIARALAYIAQVNPSGSSEPGLARSSFKQPALRFTAPSFF